MYQQKCDTALKRALALIKKSLGSEASDKMFYEYLLSKACDREDKEIIASIRDDELKHFDMFRLIYCEITGTEPKPTETEEFKKPSSYCDGIKQAIFGELGAVEVYRKIYFGVDCRKHRDMMFEIITDELKHSGKWNYLYTKNCACCCQD